MENMKLNYIPVKYAGVDENNKTTFSVVKAQEREIEKEYAELRKATVKEYLRAGRGIKDPELEEEMEDLSRQEREEIMALYIKPKKGWDNDDEF